MSEFNVPILLSKAFRTGASNPQLAKRRNAVLISWTFNSLQFWVCGEIAMLVAQLFGARKDGHKTDDDHNPCRTHRNKACTSFHR
jgi:hypothetical protein